MSQPTSRLRMSLPEAMKPARVFLVVVAIAAMGLLGGVGYPASAQTNTGVDYDNDDDGLIDVGSLAQLDAIRHDLDGDGSPTSSSAYDVAFPDAATGMGCPSAGCTGYELTTNLDFDTNGDGRTDISGDAYWNGGSGWDPIGRENSEFGATFEGNDHVISNLHISRNLSGMGLFGYTSAQGDIKRIGLAEVSVTGRWNSGGLVGANKGAITDSYVGGEYSIKGVYSVGGLAGHSTGTITGSYATSDVSGEGDVGGLVGKNGGPISASYATGDVTGIGSGQVWRVGGLVGGWDGPAVDQPISASFATGDVTGYAAVGGLIGGMRQPIVNSYATGDVTGDSRVGGLVGGTSTASTTVTNSYSAGSVTGNSETGGMVGYNFTSGLQVTASYWDTQASGQSSSAGGEGKTTSELQSPTSNTGIYATWDDDVWDFSTASEYPTLVGVGPLSPVEMDRAALVALYNATHGANWTSNTNWLSDEPLGDWHGVTTDSDGRVIRLALSSNNLAGTIPGELGSLSNLEHLDLSYSQLSGSIPPELGSLSKLTWLDLSSNQLTGAVPSQLGSLYNLTTLQFQVNQLTGSIPPELGSLPDLEFLSVANNQLTGSIPPALGNLSKLRTLSLSQNQLTGEIPSEFGTANRLRSLYLDSNQLSGNVPAELGDLSELEVLLVFSNQLTGRLPRGLTGLTKLRWFRFNATGLCAPLDESFQEWLQAVEDRDAYIQHDVQGDNCAPASPGAPTIGAVTPGTGSLDISWTAPSSDGGSVITAYDLRYIETTADETVDSNWTVVDDVWATGGGTLQHTLTGLTGGTQYDLQIRAVNAGGDGPWSATVTGTPTTAATTTATDYDADDDGLIEITSAAQLNAIRWDLDGDGAPASTNASDYSAAFPNAPVGMGCPSSGCTGYEMTAGIDLDVAPYNAGVGWEPIGTFAPGASFTATFEGNGNTISGLFINRTTSYVGLFGYLDNAGVIRDVGLTGVAVSGGTAVGGLTGGGSGTISVSYVTGTVSGSHNNVGGLVGASNTRIVASFATASVSSNADVVGGLVGANTGTITASYATGRLGGIADVGGLIGHNAGVVTASYATGAVSGTSKAGGLTGSNRGTITASYWDTEDIRPVRQ